MQGDYTIYSSLYHETGSLHVVDLIIDSIIFLFQIKFVDHDEPLHF